jgi:DNA-binding transcriptional regulator YiaG
MNSSKPLGERINAARLKLHYTLKQAAEIWQFKQSTLVNWEYNGMIPREPDRTKLFNLLAEIEANSP